ncbi:MAG TPA: hypothetical protein VFX96_07215 [Pyrinomonadaceae bacterium]|nr:hypothetical protein [Pyrinomonadaceae bacterium]
MTKPRRLWKLIAALSMLACSAVAASAQTVLEGPALARVVPPGFYYAGQSAPTQARNSTAALFGKRQHALAGMVDTSGYAADIRAVYEGFFITDGRVSVGTGALPTGAYGFGFTETGEFNVFDISGQKLMSVQTTNDPQLARPRPLMMVKQGDGVRLYSGRRYVFITTTPPEVEL